MKKLTVEWCVKAEEDYLVATREFKQNPPALNAVCFHAQQAVEKFTKAVLQENEVEFEKIHDLDVLFKQCKELLPELSNFRDDLIKLSGYAVAVRYPGYETSGEEAMQCLKILEIVRTIVKSRLKLK